MNGRIKFFNNFHGWGFIIGADAQEYFFHASAVDPSAIDQLQKDKPVVFQAQNTPKGLKATDIRLL